MRVTCLSGSPRKESNTDFLLRVVAQATGGELIKLSDFRIEPCRSCWGCVKTRRCIVEDDMTGTIVPRLLAADAIVLGSPVYFNNVSAQMKAFMDRTWALRTLLRNKIGAAIVVGRRHGAEGAITAFNAFFLKHEMIVANRGVSATAHVRGEVERDAESVREAEKLAERILQLTAFFSRTQGPEGAPPTRSTPPGPQVSKEGKK